MSKKIFIIAIFSLLLVLSSCKDDNSDTTSEGTFIGGTAGVVAEFVNLNPPSEFKQDSQVPLKVSLKNMGESQIAQGKASVKIFSPDPQSLSLTGNFKSTNGILYILDPLTNTGGEQEVDFGKIKYKPDVTNEEHITLRARFCYDYNTHTNIDVCLKSKTALESQEASICDVDGDKVVEGGGMVSSAPVQVTSVVEDSRPDKVQFAITIENKGTGTVYSPDITCENLENDDTRSTEKNKIQFKVNSPAEVMCDFKTGNDASEGTITLDESNKQIVRCWKDVEGTTEDKLKLTLTYKYRDQISKDLTILED